MGVPEVWGVEVSFNDEDPGTFGPYTQEQATRVEDRLMEEVRLSRENEGSNLHPRGVRFAGRVRLTRYDAFLTGPERREVRKAVRDKEKETARRRAAGDFE